MYRLNQRQLEIAARVSALADAHLAPHAAAVDAESRFPVEAMNALGNAGLMGLTVPQEFGGMGQGVRVAAAALDELAQRCSSTAMVYLMHLCGIACYAAAPGRTAPYLSAAAAGLHLSTLAFSERQSRSHFWAPVSRLAATNGRASLTADKSFVTSAGRADGYVVSTLDRNATTPTASTLYLVLATDAGVGIPGRWEGLGMRGNASGAMVFERVEVDEQRALTPPGRGLDMMLGVVLPLFQAGSAAVGLGIAEAAIRVTTRHLTQSRHEHQGTTLAEVPVLRARLAQMRIETDRARAHLAAVLDALETPGPTTQLLVLEAKAAATEAAVAVTEAAMRTCGGAAFRPSLGLERLFRDARAPIVMSPSTDQAHDFIGRALCGLEVFS
jgi:alkylation response protein AidB-like acyl-CoA dehydrogenase